MMEYIDDQESLAKAYDEWKDLKDFGIDIECENNHHHYGAYITLIQISSGKDWIIDVLNIKDVSSLLSILSDDTKQKIFHNIDFDFRILNYQFSCRPKNFFDTQLAAEMLGKNDIGLGSLLKTYFSIEKEKKYQRADWTKRPISIEMLDYAMNDSRYLIRLRDKLTEELKEKGKLDWFLEEMRFLESQEFEYKDPDHQDVRGYKAIDQKAQAVFMRLFELRKELARLVDKPVHFIMPNRMLLEIAQNPLGISGWQTIRGVHPIVRKRARDFVNAIRMAKIIPSVRIKAKRLSIEQREKLDLLIQKRNRIAAKNDLPGHLIITKDQMLDMILEKPVCLRDWQRKLLNS